MIKGAAGKLDIGKAKIEPVLDALISTIVEAVASGEEVNLRGFGKFIPRKRKAKLARNPKTGESVMIPEKTAVVFKPGRELKK